MTEVSIERLRKAHLTVAFVGVRRRLSGAMLADAIEGAQEELRPLSGNRGARDTLRLLQGLANVALKFDGQTMSEESLLQEMLRELGESGDRVHKCVDVARTFLEEPE